MYVPYYISVNNFLRCCACVNVGNSGAQQREADVLSTFTHAIAAQVGQSEAPTIEKLVSIIVERFITSDRAFRAPVHRVPTAVPHRPAPRSEQAPSSRERQGDQPTIAGSE